LYDLHDVHAPSPADGQVLTWVDANDRWEAVEPAGSGTGQNLTKVVTQASHGLAVGDVVRFNGTAYVEAQADSAANAEVVGIVSAVASSGEFTLTISGEVTGLSGLTAGEAYFLSAATAGALTATAPSSTGQVVKPVFIAVSTTSGYFFNMRGEVIVSSGGGSVPQEFLRLSGVAAKGSTNTLVYQLSTVVEQIGSGLTITNSSSTGGYITVSANGVYNVTFGNFNTSGSVQTIFIKKGTSVSNGASGSDADLVTYQSVSNGAVGACSTSIYLTTSDRLFFTSPFTPTNTSPLMNHVMVARIS
jgi:hypothetical protein